MKHEADVTKEEQKELDLMVIEIMTLGYLVHVHTDYCVFIRMSGHVNGLEVEIRKSQKEWQTCLTGADFNFDVRKYNVANKHIDFLRDKRDLLLHILKEKEIPYNMMDYTTETIKNYYF